jgi:hypothetical protein
LNLILKYPEFDVGRPKSKVVVSAGAAAPDLVAKVLHKTRSSDRSMV